MKRKIAKFARPSVLLNTLFLFVIAVVFLGPFLWVLASSFKNQQMIFRDLTPISIKTFWPESFTFDNYIDLFATKNIARALLNSAFIATGQVAGTLIVCSLAAYGLTRIEFRGRGLLMGLILITFVIPFEALMVPLYQSVSGLGLQDTLVAVFLPWVASPFGIFLLRTSFEEIPKELDDAAAIDGAGHFTTFFRIILPNVRTALVTLGLVTFLFSWNAFLWPLVILQSKSNEVVQVAIAQSVAPGELPNWGITFAGVIVATLPLIILFLFLQRYFIRGMAMSGIKG